MITMDNGQEVKRFEDFGFICEPGNEDPITPSFDRKTLAIPGKIGVWDFGVEIREKPFSFPLKIMDRFFTRVQRNFNDFVAFLLDPYGQPREIKIVFDYEADKHYLVNLNGTIVPERLTEESRIVFNLVASDPLKYGNVENQEIHWDSETVTFDDSYSMDSVYVNDVLITTSQTLETYVNGYALRPNILITGSGNNVTFQANGKSFSLKNFTNSTFEIKGQGYTAYKNGIDTFTEMTGDFIALLPGLNQVVISGNNLNFNLSIRVRDQYM